MNNVSKAALFTMIVMVIASLMGLVLKVRAEVYMFAPFIAVIMMLLVTGDVSKRVELRELGLHNLGIKKWPFAIVIPIVVMSLTYLVLWATPYASFRRPEDFVGVAVWLLPLKIVIFMIYYTITSSLGEEIGWRGYLLPKLSKYGWNKAFIISGLIHALFHFPLIFIGSYHNEGNPWIVIPMFVIAVVNIGVIFGYIRVQTDSVWPAAIFHAVHNIFWAIYREFTDVSNSAFSEYIGGENGIIAIMLYGLIAFWIIKKMKRGNKVE